MGGTCIYFDIILVFTLLNEYVHSHFILNENVKWLRQMNFCIAIIKLSDEWNVELDDMKIYSSNYEWNDRRFPGVD